MLLDDLAAKGETGADGAVVGALRRGVTVLGPAQRVPVNVQQHVLLLKPEPA